MTRMGKNLKIREERTFDIQRKIVAYATSKGWSETPHAVGTYRTDVTKFLKVYREYLNKYNSKRTEQDIKVLKISIYSAILKVLSEALKAAPEMNALLKYSKLTKTGTLSISEDINITMPFLLPNGNMVSPTIPDVGSKSIEEIAKYMQFLQNKVQNTNINQLLMDVAVKEKISDILHGKIGTIPSIYKGLVGKHKVKNTLKGKAKKEYYNIPESERLIPEDILGGSITMSNIGSVLRGIDCEINFADIIAPQVSCVGMSAIKKEAVVISKIGENGEDINSIEIRDMMPILICFDHRAMDFAHVPD